jgi:hypothetical protein
MSRKKKPRLAEPPAPKPVIPQQNSPFIHSEYLTSLACSLTTFALSLPLLANEPQGSDGAELVQTALRGGVLHPPGFPLQAWLDRLFILLPMGSPAHRLALLSLLAHSLSVGLVAETLKKIGMGAGGCALGALAFAFFPSSWSLGVQPEVFGLAHLWIALSFYSLARFQGPNKNLLPLLGVMATAVCGASQSPVTVTSVPALIGAGFICLKPYTKSKSDFSWKGALTVFLTLSLITLFYCSLFLLRGDALWPDWGKLSTLKGLLSHVLRSEFGTFSLTPNNLAHPYSAFELFLSQSLHFWNFLWIPFFLGILALFRGKFSHSEKSIFRWALLGSWACGIWLLWQAKTEGADDFAQALLERFEGPTLIPTALLIGIGFDFLLKKEKAQVKYLTRAAASILIFYLFISARPLANTADDSTLTVFRQAIAQDLPETSLYVAGQSEEYFSGIPIAGKLRFPVQRGVFFTFPWYMEEVAPKLEPRIDFSKVHVFSDLIQQAFDHGIPYIASIDEAIFKTTGVPAELRGLLYISNREKAAVTIQTKAPAPPPFTLETVNSAIKLCPLVRGLKRLPPGSHGYSRQLRKFIARAYDGAGIFLFSAHQEELGKIYKVIAMSLVDSSDEKIWTDACLRLESQTKFPY